MEEQCVDVYYIDLKIYSKKSMYEIEEDRIVRFRRYKNKRRYSKGNISQILLVKSIVYELFWMEVDEYFRMV